MPTTSKKFPHGLSSHAFAFPISNASTAKLETGKAGKKSRLPFLLSGIAVRAGSRMLLLQKDTIAPFLTRPWIPSLISTLIATNTSITPLGCVKIATRQFGMLVKPV
jgi:hypothetical protein